MSTILHCYIPCWNTESQLERRIWYRPLISLPVATIYIVLMVYMALSTISFVVLAIIFQEINAIYAALYIALVIGTLAYVLIPMKWITDNPKYYPRYYIFCGLMMVLGAVTVAIITFTLPYVTPEHPHFNIFAYICAGANVLMMMIYIAKHTCEAGIYDENV